MDNYYKKGISNVSYNNFLKVARCFFSWCTEKMYIKENVFATIKPKKREQKKRTIIDKDYRNIITKHLTEKGDFYFLLVMNLIYSSLIRPKEVCNLQIKHIDLENKVINIPSSISKTHYERFSAITPEIENLIEKLDITSYNKELYIFGSGKKMQPSTKPFNPHSLTKKFERLRNELNLPKNFQLYSFRDSGINNMLLSGIDALSVMQHADHHDLSITTRYANHQNKQLTDKIYNESPKF